MSIHERLSEAKVRVDKFTRMSIANGNQYKPQLQQAEKDFLSLRIQSIDEEIESLNFAKKNLTTEFNKKYPEAKNEK